MKRFKALCRFGKKYWFYLVFLILLATVLQILFSYIPLLVQYALEAIANETISAALPDFLLKFYNTILEDTTVLNTVLTVSISIVVLQASRSCMRFAHNYLGGKLTQNISYDMRVKMYDHIQTLSYSYHNNVDTGDLIQRCTSDIDTSSGFIASRFPNIINIIVTVGIGAFQVYRISPALMWVSVIAIPITGTCSVIFFRYVNKKFTEIEESESAMTTIIQENVNQSRVVKAFANEKFEFDKMDKQSKDYTQKTLKFNQTMAFFWGSQDFLVSLQYSVTVCVGIYLAYKGLMTGSQIAACILLMGMLVYPMRGLGRIIADFGKTLVAIGRIEEILELPSEFDHDGTQEPVITGEIEFKDVSFKFEDDEMHLLNHISFKVNAGETVAIMGRTGSGKSTICNILTRLLEYDSGSVLFSGVELKDISKKYLRKNVKMVLQDPFLFSRSVYDNIAITNRKTAPNNVYEAAKMAAINDDISKFELGYNTIVGEKGATLSGGQKQRVAIARILIEECPVIIFDDSLSAVDTETDLMIRRALKSRDKKVTTFIITHRTTTAKEADKIIVLDNGSISEIGTHKELVSVEGLYKRLWDIQGNLEEEFEKFIEGGDSSGKL